MSRGQLGVRRWWIAAIVWGGLSLAIINEHFRVSGGGSWQEMWFLCSLLWFQFGIGRVMVSLFRKQHKLLREQLLIALLPPVALYLLIAPSVLQRPDR
ncbi:MAG: hypothetical protein HQL69_21735 [Magnetococcales bacterium]|nr:hypothetical protein [Magnetococcales bacterium]